MQLTTVYEGGTRGASSSNHEGRGTRRAGSSGNEGGIIEISYFAETQLIYLEIRRFSAGNTARRS